jgi:hypothetical protein
MAAHAATHDVQRYRPLSSVFGPYLTYVWLDGPEWLNQSILYRR